MALKAAENLGSCPRLGGVGGNARRHAGGMGKGTETTVPIRPREAPDRVPLGFVNIDPA
ncbi:hypothetical protein FBY34_0566 [Streptomyces sp. SLBN-115]|nr:hypothetical protein FBY34_0566 [Streptomyces sp. SLBN-115]